MLATEIALLSPDLSLSNLSTMRRTSAQESAVIGFAPSGIAIRCLCFAETMAALSVSQNRNVPPASLMHLSSIASSNRPPDVMREAMCGANHFPGSSTTSDVVSKDSSPE
jgi:hypothetical protein